VVAVVAAPGQAGPTLHCYEPTTGEVRTVTAATVRHSRLVGLGYPRPFAFALPYSNV
jgi:hypothetical protein